MPKLLLATNNQAKVREYRRLLQGLDYQLVTPAELGLNIAVDESGGSMEENATLKATTFAAASGLLAMADDSGLEVDALGGQPGVLSARYAGEEANDRDRVNYLLSRLKDVPLDKRGARFRCIIAIARPDGLIEIVSGECKGLITFEPKGEHGFGYDPIFYLPDVEKTMAELPLELKNQVSHRGRAAARAARVLQRLKEGA